MSAKPPDELGLRMRQVMRQWVTGVTVLTAREGELMRGMTCNSFNSVSDSPPTVLVSIRQGTQTHDMVAATQRYALTILPAAQEDLSNRFAGLQGDEAQSRFDDVPHTLSPGGLPWLVGGLGYLECRVVLAHDLGASTLFVAQVEIAEPGDAAAAPLVRFRSAYTKL